jgi:uncharacterized protein (TIGR02246 family)
MDDTASDESEIRRLMNEWREALCAKDADRMVAHYAPHVLLFEVTPPYQHKGPETYRANWQACFPHLPPSLGSETREMAVTVKGDLAFAHGLHRLTDKITGKAATCGWVRVTVCFQRREGRWQVVHEHASVPFDPMTSKAVFIDQP